MLISQKRCNSLRHHGLNKHSMFSAPDAMIGILLLLKGDHRHFEYTKFRKGTLDFGLEFKQLLQNDFCKITII